jgi:methionine synthase II (cobalamin-independent)
MPRTWRPRRTRPRLALATHAARRASNGRSCPARSAENRPPRSGEYHLFEHLRLPADKVLCPGVITHASNIVEHPELIAERLLRYAHLVGREHVVAGADCGFSSLATDHTEVHPSVVWAKLEALAEGTPSRERAAVAVSLSLNVPACVTMERVTTTATRSPR